MFVPQILHTIFLNIMKTKLFFLAFLTSLLSWGQATLPVSRTSNWNTATVTGWTHTGTTDRTSTFACSGGNAETFDTTGDRIVLFVNAAPNQLIFKLYDIVKPTS